MRLLWIPLCFLACGTSTPRTGGPSTPDSPTIGDPCQTDADCNGLVCVDIVPGAQTGACTQVDCLSTSPCPAGAECVEIGLPDVPSMCVVSDATDFCSTSCSSELRCALDTECLEAGCCGALTCPAACLTISGPECEMASFCPKDCCY